MSPQRRATSSPLLRGTAVPVVSSTIENDRFNESATTLSSPRTHRDADGEQSAAPRRMSLHHRLSVISRASASSAIRRLRNLLFLQRMPGQADGHADQ